MCPLATVAPARFLMWPRLSLYSIFFPLFHDSVTAIDWPCGASWLNFPLTEQPRWRLTLMGEFQSHSEGKYVSDVCRTKREYKCQQIYNIFPAQWSTSSQCCVTNKCCHPLHRVHVVFGVVISGFEVVKKIEGLKTDSASRPYADARVMDCGQLITKSANDGECGGGSTDVDSI